MAKGSKLLARSVTGLVALAIFMTLIWTPGLRLLLTLFIGALSAVGLFEYYAMVRARKISPETIGGMLAGTCVAMSGHFGDAVTTNFALFGGCVLVSALHIVRGCHSVAGLSSSVFGVFYIGWFGAHVPMMQSLPGVGPGLVTTLFVAVILTDTAAFFVGSSIGKHKMAPKVSPNKTWEGAFGGLFCAVAGTAALWYLRERAGITALPDWSLWRYIHAGILVSIVAQIGDLTESCIKRDAGVKDSGNFFPGHGGVLDRTDGFLFAAPVLYYLVTPFCAG
ncbi:MAG TPA: phosphatidate cytidylyltransferase [Candidatus Hydrogenedentes bacterium]|nr:phosphatidate cytidylyltransferase [Candidatus Hydrogenedentota bacterium]